MATRGIPDRSEAQGGYAAKVRQQSAMVRALGRRAQWADDASAVRPETPRGERLQGEALISFVDAVNPTEVACNSACTCPMNTRMTDDELQQLAREIRHLYFFIRTLRRGVQDAPRRRYYRLIAAKKKRLLGAGVSAREVLDLLMCCRSGRCCFRACLDCSHRLL